MLWREGAAVAAGCGAGPGGPARDGEPGAMPGLRDYHQACLVQEVHQPPAATFLPGNSVQATQPSSA